MHMYLGICVTCMYATPINMKRDHEFGRDPAGVYGRTRREGKERGNMIIL